MTTSPTSTELLALRTAHAALLNSPDALCDMVSTIVFALGSAQLLQSPETAAEWQRERDSLAAQADRVIRAEQRRAELEAVLGSHRMNDEAEIARLRTRVAELEAAATKTAEFCAQRAEYITNLRNCNPNADHDYYRWSGHAAARRQLSRLLDLPVGWPAEDSPAAPPAPIEDKHDSPLHHDYRLSHDMPDVPRG